MRSAWYARQAVEHGWSRYVLAHQIESKLFVRQGGVLTNVSRTLPAEQSELAQQILKDPYTFNFLSLGPDLLERDLERGLIELKIEDFKPEFAGKMNFYLSAVDDQLRHQHDQPTIWIILCRL